MLDGLSALYQQDISKVKWVMGKIDLSHMKLLKPIFIIFKSQCSLMLSDEIGVEQGYQELLHFEKVKLIALQGLINIRMNNKSYHDALIYAKMALDINPKLCWLMKNLVDIYMELGQYDEVEQVVKKSLKYNFIDSNEENSLLAKCYIAMAEKFQDDLKLEQAIDYLKKAWKKTPSLEVARIILALHHNESINKRIKLMEGLISAAPNSSDGYLAMAEFYIKEDMLTAARTVMDKLLTICTPDRNISKVMAIIETKAHVSHSIILNWLNRL